MQQAAGHNAEQSRKSEQLPSSLIYEINNTKNCITGIILIVI
jgi:hypothetical protein